MCGISGIYQFGSAKLIHQLGQFNDSLIHRGPDFQNTYLSPRQNLGLGHCRLSIIDLSEQANQPYGKYDDRYWLSFNGEIYNYLELKTELEKLGEHFLTNSDTEVIVTAYKVWGENCLHKFNGMWAFAIWDNYTQQLFIARDRFGVKPLYYAHKADFFAFASEQKSFKHLNTNVGQISPSMASAALFNPPAIESQRETIYCGVNKLLPGEYLTIDRANKLSLNKWWDTYSELNSNDRTSVDVEELLHLFEEACLIRTRSDVDLAASLSGGLDSSAVTCFLGGVEEVKNKNFKAFIGSFKGSSLDEYKWAKYAVDSVGIEYERVEIGAQEVSSYIEKSSESIEEISFLPAIGQASLYAEMNKQGYKVSLEGHGGDELFGGYPSHISAYVGDVLTAKSDVAELASSIVQLGGAIGHFSQSALDLKGKILQSTSNVTRINHRTNSLTDFIVKPEKLGADLFSLINNPQFKSESNLFQKLYFDFHYFTLPNILRNYDRLSMANSVEVRAPFLDYRFVLAAFRCRQNIRIKQGKSKIFLREHCHFIPQSIRTRKDKLGFSPPMGEWFSTILREWLGDIINESAFQNSSVFNGHKLQQKLNQLIDGNQYDKVSTYWPLISLHLLARNVN